MNEDRTVIVVDKNGKEIKIYIKDLSLHEREEADSIRVKKWNRAIQNGAIFAEKLNNVLKEQGIWDEQKEEEIFEIRREIDDYLNILDKGGIKLSEAKDIALKIKKMRDRINMLSINRIRHINQTIEGQAQNAEFDYLVSVAAVYDDNKEKYFSSYEDYLNRKNDLDAYLIANKLAEVMYGGSEEVYPENQFLKEYGFINEKMQLINKDGHTCDEKGRLTDEFGNLIKYNEKGEKIYIDEDGNSIKLDIEKKPFLTDDGLPILKDEPKPEIVENKEDDGVVSKD